jgi:hypothetical protein
MILLLSLRGMDAAPKDFVFEEYISTRDVATIRMARNIEYAGYRLFLLRWS